MKKASEMRTIANEVNEMKRRERELKIKNFVENEIEPIIEKMANDGYIWAEVPTGGKWMMKEVVEFLESYEYKVKSSAKEDKMIVTW